MNNIEELKQKRMTKLVIKYMKENYDTFEKIGVVYENTYQCWFEIMDCSTYLDLDFEMVDGKLTIVNGLRTIDLNDEKDDIDQDEYDMVIDLLEDLDLLDVVEINNIKT